MNQKIYSKKYLGLLVKKINRCSWLNLNNPLYVKYHDEEWGKLNKDDKYLFEMLILEMFQGGLSWEIILNKREEFRKAFSFFDVNKIIDYKEEDIERLMNNKDIIRNKQKIKSVIINALTFKEIVEENGNFYNYLSGFTHGEIIREVEKTSSSLSLLIATELKRRGMKYVGSKTIYSYLQGIGIINGHDEKCDFR